MKSYELKPTTENLFQTFANDRIGRNRYIQNFCRIINNLDGACSIAIDGAWGSGKTFFIKQVQMVLDAHNNNITSTEMNDTQKESIQNTWNTLCGQTSIDLQPQVCVYYDAWENDTDEDPMLSFVYSITQSINTDFVFSEDSKFIPKATAMMKFFAEKSIFAKITKSIPVIAEHQEVVGGAVSALADTIIAFDSAKTSSIFSKQDSKKQLESDIKDFLDSLLPEKGNRLVVFIDELDRCNPSFAVRLLERIKHYFDNERITFVFSINAHELEHTIKKHYGADFDAGRYLDRFFDYRFGLPAPNMEKFYQSIKFNYSSYWYEGICKAFIDTYHLSLREISRYTQLTKIAASDFSHGGIYSSDDAFQYSVQTVLPVIIGLKLIGSQQYERFITGQDCEPLLRVAQKASPRQFGFLLGNNEVYVVKRPDKDVLVQLSDKIREFYDALLSDKPKPKNEYGYGIEIGQVYIQDETKEKLLRTVTLLSNISNFS